MSINLLPNKWAILWSRIPYPLQCLLRFLRGLFLVVACGAGLLGIMFGGLVLGTVITGSTAWGAFLFITVLLCGVGIFWVRDYDRQK